jgi:transcriptional regulator with XRE-family HTH domain
MRDFASIVKNARANKGLTLQKLADKLGTKKGYCSGIENRKVNPPSPKITKKMAKVLGLDETELLVYGYIEKAPADIQDFVRKSLTAALHKLTGKCSSCDQERCVCDRGQDQVVSEKKPEAAAV